MSGDSSLWGSRARLGMLVIHNDGVPETEFRMMAPPGVGVYVARMQSPRRKGHEYEEDLVKAFVESPDLNRGAEMLGSMPLDCIAVCFTSGSLLAGLEWDRRVTERVRDRAGGTPAVAGATSMLLAMSALGIRHPYVVFPAWFSDELLEAGERFLRSNGSPPAGVIRASMGAAWKTMTPSAIYDGGGHWQQDPELVYRDLMQTCPAASDAVAILGSGMRAAELIGVLERDLGRPVLTAQQTLLWCCLRTVGLGDVLEGYGELFSKPLPRNEPAEAARDR